MVAYTFPSYPALDPTTETLVRGASGQVYDINDTAGTTPLAITDLNGLPLAEVKTTEQGITAPFRVEGKPEVIWRSGSYAIPLSSPKAMRDAAEQAAIAAQGSQAAAETAASTMTAVSAQMVKSINGVTPDGAGNVTISTGGGGSGGAVTSVAGKTGDVSLVKADVGLASADNTSDANKPVSTLQAAAIATKAALTHSHGVPDVIGLQAALDSKAGINTPVNASQVNAGTGVITPARLGTGGTGGTTRFLREDGTYQVPAGGGGGGAVSSVNGETGDVSLDAADVGAMPASTVYVSSVAGRNGAVTLARADVGLGAVDNTSDSAKPVSTATQTALDAKANANATVNLTGNQTVAGTKTFSAAPVVPDASFPQAKVTGLVSALAGKVGSSTVLTIWTGSQSAFDAISPKDSATLYFVTGA